jgi:murein DD-endopeptidase MepM/ murein hydrolase activator NlpD
MYKRMQSSLAEAVPAATARLRALRNALLERATPLSISVAAVLTLAAVTAVAVAPRAAPDLPPTETVVEPLALQSPGIESLDRFVQAERVRRGDSLASLLARLGALDPAFQRFVAVDPVARKVLSLTPGRTVLAELDGSGLIKRLSYRLDEIADSATGNIAPGRRVLIERKGSRLVAREERASLERSTEVRSAQIETNLYAATETSGIPDSVVAQLNDLFGQYMDLRRDLHRGDRLRVAWETVREAGSFDQPAAGRLLAAEVVSGSTHREAFWFERSGHGRGARGDYYSADGRALRHHYLKSPLEFSRVMSSFSPSRFDPVLHKWRAHTGVDLSAPLGTRVRCVADGTVETVQQHPGYGNMVVIRHSAKIKTVYAHLNEFAAGLRPGDSVSQGDLIGYVGRTGWATGPHLHFEFMVDGHHTDPMTAALEPGAAPLDGSERKRLAELARSRHAELARAETLTQVARFQ